MSLTRKECERQIIEKLKEIAKIHKQYNPNANYLDLCIIESDGYYNAVNQYSSVDKDAPINVYVFEKEDEEDE